MSVKRLTALLAGGAAAGAALSALTAAPAIAAADSYVAIAYSPDTGIFGWANNASTRAAAESAAMAYCAQYGGTDCQIAVWTKNGCAALAVDADSWNGGYAATSAAAEAQALSENGGGTIEVSKCSS